MVMKFANGLFITAMLLWLGILTWHIFTSIDGLPFRQWEDRRQTGHARVDTISPAEAITGVEYDSSEVEDTTRYNE